MSKKKKKKQHKNDFFIEIDRSLDRKYIDLIEEIQFMQADLKREERKVKRKAKKKLKKGGFYTPTDYDRKIRRQLVYQMEGTNFFDRATNILNELKPICAVIAKLVMTLIIAILSIDSIKYTIKPETLSSMNRVYTLAKSVSSSIVG